jgi:hypothetical protein
MGRLEVSQSVVPELKAVLCDGLVYTDDSLFWLSKIKPNSHLRFVYGTVTTQKQNINR